MKNLLSLSLSLSRNNKLKHIVNLVFFFAILLGSFFVFGSGARASSASDYWKTYFSTEELKAVQKNAEKYTLAQIKNKSDQWHNILTGFNIKNGSIIDDNIKKNEIATNKIKGLGDFIDEKISGSSTPQDFSADNLTGSYAALDGSQITNLNPVNITGSGNLNIGNGDLFVDDTSGNVGVGTTTPNFSLDVNGAVRANTFIGGTGITDILKFQGTSGNGTLTSPAIQALVGNNGGTTALTILNNGNVSIGYAVDPPTKLSVGGTIRESKAYTTLNHHAYDAWDVLNIDVEDLVNGYSAYDAYPIMNNSANVNHFYGYQSTLNYSGSGNISSVSPYTGRLNHTGTGNIENYYGAYFRAPTITNGGTITNAYGLTIEAVSAGSAKNYAVYSTGGDVHFVGNMDVVGKVAINALTSVSTLQVGSQGTATDNDITIMSKGNSVNAISTINFNQTVGGGNANSIMGRIQATSASDGTGNKINFYAGAWNNNNAPGTSKMTITGVGNVGIGTATPVAALDVNGEVKLKIESSQPFACDATHSGTIALTSAFRTCVCKGTTTTWVFTTDGTTTCTW